MNANLSFDATLLWHIAGWTMIHFLWLGTLLAAAALLARLLARRASPDLRYATAVASLVLLAATPVAIAAWLVVRSDATLHTAHLPPLAAQPAVADAVILADSEGSPNASSDAAFAVPRVAEAPLAGPVTFELPALPRFASGREPFAEAARSAIPYLPWLWIVGTPVTFAVLAVGLVGTRRLRRASRLAHDGPAAELLRRLAASLQIDRHVALAVCDRIAAPVLVGIVRPMILLPPAALTGWSPDEIEMVLLHELAHVRRWDNLVNLLQRLVESLLFFHPAVWLISNWVRREREACCDSLVVARTQRPHAYAELILALAAQLPRSVLFHPAASSAMAAGPLRRRIRCILNLQDDPMLISGKFFMLMLVALVTMLAATLLYLPTIGQAEEAATSDESVAAGERGPSHHDSANANQTESSDQPRTAGLERALQKKITLVVVMFNDAGRYRPQLRPIYENLSRQGKTIWLYGIDIDPASDEAKRYGVGAKPTLIIFRHGKETARLENIESAEQLTGFVAEKLLGAATPDRRSSGDSNAPPVAEFPHTVPFEQGTSQFEPGDNISVQEVRGTSDSFEPGNRYWIRGTYTLASREQATLSASVTAKDPADGISKSSPAQRMHIRRGQGSFTLILPMRHPGWPHISFYPAEGGTSFGGTYFGTGDSVLHASEREQASKRVLATFPPDVMGTNPAPLFKAFHDAQKKGLYVELKPHDDQLALVVVPAPTEKNWPEVLGPPPRKNRVIAEKAWPRLGLKIVPLSNMEVIFRNAAGKQKGVQIVGGDVPDGLPLPSVLTIVDGQAIDSMDSLLLWLESEKGRSSQSVKCYAVADDEEYLFYTKPADETATPAKRPEQADSKESALRYDGKTFDQWRSEWQTELSTEKRLEAIKALAAFGANGYGREAAEAILDVVKQYQWGRYDRVALDEDTPNGELMKQAVSAFADDRGPHIPPRAGLSVLADAIRSGDENLINFAGYVLWTLGSNDEWVPFGIELSRDESLKSVHKVILKRLQFVHFQSADPRIVARMEEALTEDPESALIALKTLYGKGGIQMGLMRRDSAGAEASQSTSDEYRDRLIELLKMKSLREEVLEVLAELGPKAEPALPHLYPLLLDEDYRICSMAYRAIAAITGSHDAAIEYLQERRADDDPLESERAERILELIENSSEQQEGQRRQPTIK